MIEWENLVRNIRGVLMVDAIERVAAAFGGVDGYWERIVSGHLWNVSGAIERLECVSSRNWLARSAAALAAALALKEWVDVDLEKRMLP